MILATLTPTAVAVLGTALLTYAAVVLTLTLIAIVSQDPRWNIPCLYAVLVLISPIVAPVYILCWLAIKVIECWS